MSFIFSVIEQLLNLFKKEDEKYSQMMAEFKRDVDYYYN